MKPAASKSGAKVRKDQWIVRPTEAGRDAQETWRPLAAEIEKRWDARFGKENVNQLRTSLAALIGRFDVDLPEYFLVLKYGLFAEARPGAKNNSGGTEPAVASGRPLYALLSQVLLAFTMEFESESDGSLAISEHLAAFRKKWSTCGRAAPPFRRFERGCEDVFRLPRARPIFGDCG